jgi:PTS system N-acetylglucosamine-specific IIC component
MIHTARPERRKAIAGILGAAALTSFLTGITEPIEFAFVFVAPPLFLVHAILTGLSLVICNLLGIRDGFTFSAGFSDWGLNFLGHNHEKPWLILVVGAAYAVIYYAVFRFMIVKFDLKTPGREPPGVDDEQEGVIAAIPHQSATAATTTTSARAGEGEGKG